MPAEARLTVILAGGIDPIERALYEIQRAHMLGLVGPKILVRIVVGGVIIGRL